MQRALRSKQELEMFKLLGLVELIVGLGITFRAAFYTSHVYHMTWSLRPERRAAGLSLDENLAEVRRYKRKTFAGFTFVFLGILIIFIGGANLLGL